MGRLNKSDIQEARLHMMDVKEIGDAMFQAMPALSDVDIAFSRQDLEQLELLIEVAAGYNDLKAEQRKIERRKRAGGDIL